MDDTRASVTESEFRDALETVTDRQPSLEGALQAYRRQRTEYESQRQSETSVSRRAETVPAGLRYRL